MFYGEIVHDLERIGQGKQSEVSVNFEGSEFEHSLKANGEISLENIGVWAEDLYFLKGEKGRSALEKKFYGWKMEYSGGVAKGNYKT